MYSSGNTVNAVFPFVSAGQKKKREEEGRAGISELNIIEKERGQTCWIMFCRLLYKIDRERVRKVGGGGKKGFARPKI